MEKFHTEFCSNTLKYDWCVHRTCFSGFSDNTSTTDMIAIKLTDCGSSENCFDMLNCVFGICFWWMYCEIQRSGIFQTLSTIATKHKHFGNKIYNHSDMTGYTCSTVRYSTQTATDELIMHTTVQTGFNSIVKVLMCVLFMTVCENLSFVVLHNLQPLQFPCLVTHTLHMTAHMCTQNFSLQGSELRPYINCVWFWKLLTHSLHGAVLLEKLTGLQPVKKFPVFYGTRKFITAFYVIKFMLEV